MMSLHRILDRAIHHDLRIYRNILCLIVINTLFSCFFKQFQIKMRKNVLRKSSQKRKKEI